MASMAHNRRLAMASSLAALCAPGAMGLAQTRKEATRVVWERTYGDPGGAWYEYQAGTLSPAGEIVIAVTAHVPESRINAVRVLTLDQQGEKRSDVGPSTSDADTRNVSDIKAVFVLDNGDRLLFLDLVENRPALLRLDPSGKVLLKKTLLSTTREVSVSRVVRLAASSFLLLGQESGDAVAVKVDAQGGVPWEKSFDRGKTDFFVDGAPLPDGGLALVGDSGQYDMFQAGPSTVWIGEYDATGAPKQEPTVLPGRYGSVANTTDGAYVVAFDKGDRGRQDIVLQGFARAAKPSWVVPIFSGPGMQHFRVAAVAGGFVVVGGKDSQPWVVGVSAPGKRTWEFWGETMLRSAAYDVFGWRDEALVVSSVFVETTGADGKRTAPQQVRVFKLKAAP
jgi:hypothetical protein